MGFLSSCYREPDRREAAPAAPFDAVRVWTLGVPLTSVGTVRLPVRLAGAAAFAVIYAACFLSVVRAEEACPRAGTETARVTGVEPRLVLRLADGRALRLVGLDPVGPTPSSPDRDETARKAFEVQLKSTEVSVRFLADRPDRWGRLPAFVFRAGRDTAGGLTGEAIAAGEGRYLVEPGTHVCRDALLAAEATARAGKLGLWGDPYYGIVAVDDRAAFLERSATLIVAEGKLVAVQPGTYRTTLRFAPPMAGLAEAGRRRYGGRMLVATIVPHAMKTFQARKVDLRAMIGHRVRLRGLLDTRFGPQIELTDPDEIEMLDASAPASPD
jgi:endonuclease YncB( thermonuclease family)